MDVLVAVLVWLVTDLQAAATASCYSFDNEFELMHFQLPFLKLEQTVKLPVNIRLGMLTK